MSAAVPVSAEGATIAAIEAVRQRLAATAQAARSRAAFAQTTLDQAERAEGEARATDGASPTDATARAVHTAIAATALAQSRLAEASKAVETADRDLASAEEGIQSAKLEARKDLLRRRAAPETLAAAIADPWKQVLAAYKMLEGAATTIGTTYAESAKASSELTALGELSHPLDPTHAIVPLLEHLASKGIAVGDFTTVRPSEIAKTPVRTIVDLLHQHVHRDPSPPDHVAGALHRIRRLKVTRTAHDAELLERHELREAGDSTELAKEAVRLQGGGLPWVRVETSHGPQMKQLDLSELPCVHRSPAKLRRVGENYVCMAPGCNAAMKG